MKERTKLTLAVSIGTIAIELSLIAILWSIFVEALPLITTFDQQVADGGVGSGYKSLLIVAALTALVLSFAAYSKASDYLRSQMCWALARHFHGKGLTS